MNDIETLNQLKAVNDNVLPSETYNWLENQVDSFWENWETTNKDPCYMYLSYTRRFFPKTEVKEWKKLAENEIKDNYPNFAKNKPVNYFNNYNTKAISNYTATPKLQIDNTEILHIKTLLEVLQQFKLAKLEKNLWYNLCINKKYCSLLLKELSYWTKSLYELYPKMVRETLYWCMYTLAHQEATAKTIDIDDTFVFKLDEVLNLSFLNNISPELSPWIINALEYELNIYNACPFYLEGKRSICDYDEFVDRFNSLTHGYFKAFERYDNVAVVGSTLVRCISNTPLGDFKSSEIYYPKEGNFESDLDIAVRVDNFKGFVTQVDEMIKLLNAEAKTPFDVVENCTASGLRFHLRHPDIPFKIEIFRISDTFTKLVSRFHVSIVRMYWDFKNIYLLRSSATALLTGINENFYWFANNKNPTDIILKYAQRGFTTVLNTKELECLYKWLPRSEFWNYDFLKKRSDMLGCFSKDHPFFRPDVNCKGVRTGLPQLTECEYNMQKKYIFNEQVKLYQEEMQLKKVAIPSKV